MKYYTGITVIEHVSQGQIHLLNSFLKIFHWVYVDILSVHETNVYAMYDDIILKQLNNLLSNVKWQ